MPRHPAAVAARARGEGAQPPPRAGAQAGQVRARREHQGRQRKRPLDEGARVPRERDVCAAEAGGGATARRLVHVGAVPREAARPHPGADPDAGARAAAARLRRDGPAARGKREEARHTHVDARRHHRRRQLQRGRAPEQPLLPAPDHARSQGDAVRGAERRPPLGARAQGGGLGAGAAAAARDGGHREAGEEEAGRARCPRRRRRRAARGGRRHHRRRRTGRGARGRAR